MRIQAEVNIKEENIDEPKNELIATNRNRGKATQGNHPKLIKVKITDSLCHILKMNTRANSTNTNIKALPSTRFVVTFG